MGSSYDHTPEKMMLDGKPLPTVKQLLERYIALCGMHAEGKGENEVPWKSLNEQLDSEKNRAMMDRLQEGGMGDIVYSMLTKTPENSMDDSMISSLRAPDDTAHPNARHSSRTFTTAEKDRT